MFRTVSAQVTREHFPHSFLVAKKSPTLATCYVEVGDKLMPSYTEKLLSWNLGYIQLPRFRLTSASRGHTATAELLVWSVYGVFSTYIQVVI